MVAQPQPSLTPSEYLTWEAQQPQRFEYTAGQIVAMTGGTIPHNQVAINLIALLRPHLRGQSCKILSADAKVAISEAGPFYYPDLSVTCDPRDQTAREYIRFPRLIIEVLSPSTEARDRGLKFRHYRQIETLQEYVLIDPDRVLVEPYRRNERDNWELVNTLSSPAALTDTTVTLTSINLDISLAQIYEDIAFPTTDSE